MRTFLTTLFYLAFGIAVVSVLALIFYPYETRDVLVALIFTTAAVAIYMGRYTYLVRFGRLGLLKPKLHWRPLSAKNRSKVQAASVAGQIIYATSYKARYDEFGPSDGSLQSIVFREMNKPEMRDILGHNSLPRSDDEFESERLLTQFMEEHKEDRCRPPVAILRNVRCKDVFLRMRKLVDDWYAEHRALSADYRAWLAEVGNLDQSHLLKDGWIPFLEGLPGSDIHLWHAVATDLDFGAR